ncbi:MAG: ABC transporter permease, partial [Oligoflexia bacterium]|nr:ABC transporter permease [Oligoflexia bacterium]
MQGVNQDYLQITKRELLLGRNFTVNHIDNKSLVCIVGFEIAKKLFKNETPLGKILSVSGYQISTACKIVGVLKEVSTNKEWVKPNLQVFIPYTTFKANSSSSWGSEIHQLMIYCKISSQ